MNPLRSILFGSCLLTPTASDNNRDLYFRRLCGSGNLTLTECAGLVDPEEHRSVVVPEDGDLAGVEVVTYQSVPFVCGRNFSCRGSFYADDEVWYVKCNEGLQGVRCGRGDAQYERMEGGRTFVRCVGRTMLFLDLTYDQFKK